MIDISDLTDIFKLFGVGLVGGFALSVVFFLVGHVVNFLLDIIRKS